MGKERGIESVGNLCLISFHCYDFCCIFITISTEFPVLATLNDRFRHCLSMTKMLNAEGSPLAAVSGLTSSGSGSADSAAAACNLTADRILYQHAVSQCQEAALDELLGSPGGCVQVRFTNGRLTQILARA